MNEGESVHRSLVAEEYYPPRPGPKTTVREYYWSFAPKEENIPAGRVARGQHEYRNQNSRLAAEPIEQRRDIACRNRMGEGRAGRGTHLGSSLCCPRGSGPSVVERRRPCC